MPVVKLSCTQRWLTEQTNRTEHFRGRVRFVRVRRHIEQNRTVPLFGSCSPGFRTLTPLFGSVRIELEPNSTLVRFVFGKFGLFKAKSTTLYFLGVGLIPGLGSHIINNGRRAEAVFANLDRWIDPDRSDPVNPKDCQSKM